MDLVSPLTTLPPLLFCLFRCASENNHRCNDLQFINKDLFQPFFFHLFSILFFFIYLLLKPISTAIITSYSFFTYSSLKLHSTLNKNPSDSFKRISYSIYTAFIFSFYIHSDCYIHIHNNTYLFI